MPRRYSKLLQGRVLKWILFLCICAIILCLRKEFNKGQAYKLRFNRLDVPFFECTNKIKEVGDVKEFYAEKLNFPSIQSNTSRILLVHQHNSSYYNVIKNFLEYYKLPIRVESEKENRILFELVDGGRFTAIVFENYQIYHNLQSSERLRLHRYCDKFGVRIISFIHGANLGNEKFEKFSYFDNRNISALEFPKYSPIRHIAKASRLPMDEHWKHLTEGWTLFDTTFSSQVSSILDAEDLLSKRKLSAALLINETNSPKSRGHVLFGYGIEHFVVKVVLADSLDYLITNSRHNPLERFVQIDIDDVFVGASGTRFTPGDVTSLLNTQKELREFIDAFTFTLGFSGYFFRHGDPIEIRGDEILLANADKFNWFPHMWRHNHVQDYSDEYLQALMTQNKLFANNTNINASLAYAVSPQHSGVYPIYQSLYNSWRNIWNIYVTSTEEYPHLRPPSKRRGFIHANISVLPRQTCGLFTHTMFFHAYPDGIERLLESIFGGELFTSILMNKFSIFMTHQQNFANDRLGTFTFVNLARFISCWTNLRLRWIPPLKFAQFYFERFPKEKKLLYTNPCADNRHKRMLPNSFNCTNLTLPNLLILGPQKTGTSALSLFMSMHPNISTNIPLPGSFEELQFFGGRNYPRGFSWYADKFVTTLNLLEKRVIFEKSANYFDSEDAPPAVHALLPNTNLLVILNDPVDRAYSWYQHMRAHKDPIANKYSAEEVFMGNFSETVRLKRRCLLPGLYAQHLDRWLDFFPPSQILLIDGKRLRHEPGLVLTELFDRLNLTPMNVSQRLRYVPEKGFYCLVENSSRLKCLGQNKGRRYAAMSSILQHHLDAYYTPPNTALVALLNSYKFTIVPAVPSFLISP